MIDFNKFFESISLESEIAILNSKPDGDSISSSLALNLFLNKAGFKAYSFTAFEKPDYLDFLSKKGPIELLQSNETLIKYDIIILVDSCTIERCTKQETPVKFSLQAKIFGFDHHKYESESRFDIEKIVDINAESTAGIITDLIEFYSSKTGQNYMDEDIAFLLYSGIVSDTDFFSYLNVTPRTFERANILLSQNFDPTQIVTVYKETLSLQAFDFIREILHKVIVNKEKKFAYLKIYRDDYDPKFNLQVASEALNFLLRTTLRIINEVNFAFVIREITGQKSSVSFRAHNNGNKIDLSEIAKKLGGGGHPKASGAIFNGSVNELEKTLLKLLH